MMNPIAVISIMGLYSPSHGICIKVFIAVSGKEFRQLAIVYVTYVTSIIVSFIF